MILVLSREIRHGQAKLDEALLLTRGGGRHCATSSLPQKTDQQHMAEEKDGAYVMSSPSPSHRIPGFVSKAFEIFSNESYKGICGWGRDGKTIVVRDIQVFSVSVLPNHFKHSNYSSFVRQLNMYVAPDNCANVDRDGRTD